MKYKIMKHYEICLGDMYYDYDKLKTQLDEYYNDYFELKIDTKNISNVSFKMMVDFSIYLHKLKMKTPKYLTRSKIIVYSQSIYDMLYTLFMFLTKPIAPVDVILYNNNVIVLLKTFFP